MHAQQPRVDAIRELAPKLNVREDGTLGAEADPEEVVARGDERELFAVWTTYHVRRWIEHVLGTLQGKDDADSERARREFAKDLAAMAPANELHALEANRRLVDLLTGRLRLVGADDQVSPRAGADGVRVPRVHPWR